MAQYTSETVIARGNSGEVLAVLRKAHAETAHDEDGGSGLGFDYGKLRVANDGRGCRIAIAAPDRIGLSYLKLAVAGPLAPSLGGDNELVWSGEEATGGRPAFFRELRLLSAKNLSPHMRRLCFAVEDTEGLQQNGLHVRLLFPPEGRTPQWPTVGRNGLLVWPDGPDAPTARVYTLRSVDVARGTVEIDFALHPGSPGPGMRFAQTAACGTVIGMLGPGGGGVPKATEVILCGDETALPAIGRIVETLPAATKVRAFIEVEDAGDEHALSPSCHAEITWLHRNGVAAGSAGLLADAVKGIEASSLADDCYFWAGCSFSDFRAIRTHVRKEWRLPKNRHLVVAYWRPGTSGEFDR